jgi:hypothetical protein
VNNARAIHILEPLMKPSKLDHVIARANRYNYEGYKMVQDLPVYMYNRLWRGLCENGERVRMSERVLFGNGSNCSTKTLHHVSQNERNGKIDFLSA